MLAVWLIQAVVVFTCKLLPVIPVVKNWLLFVKLAKLWVEVKPMWSSLASNEPLLTVNVATTELLPSLPVKDTAVGPVVFAGLVFNTVNVFVS